MTWNYRLVKLRADTPLGEVFAVCEVYYRPDGTVKAWSEPVTLDGYESPTEILRDLPLMARALSEPVLDEMALPDPDRHHLG